MTGSKTYDYEERELTPDQRPLTYSQADRLLKLTNVSDLSIKDLQGSTIREVSDRLKWIVDPEFFFFRRICGRVVKKDPVSGIDYPVPFATVHVEDTDCSFLGLFPVESPWAWFYPISCSREEIGTVRTDACGNFCVWIPWFEIDYMLRWRRLWYCYGDIFIKPSIRDILDAVKPPFPHPPEEDLPARFQQRLISQASYKEPASPTPLLGNSDLALRRVEGLLGRETAMRLGGMQTAALGESTTKAQELLDQPAFPYSLPPWVPTQVRERLNEFSREELAAQFKINVEAIQNLDFSRYIGPFWKCEGVLVPEFTPILDVPDITFRVTQDVDADGIEETIYSESFFDVRWNDTAIPDITLYASQIAAAVLTCNPPTGMPCDEPQILTVGAMSFTSPTVVPYHDAVSGYARRPNKPHPGGADSEVLPPGTLAKTPYCYNLDLRGCNQFPGAKYYRLRYSFNGQPPVPMHNPAWTQIRPLGVSPFIEVHPITSDADGWYEILDPADGWMDPNLLVHWVTGQFQDGLYAVDMQVADASKNLLNPPGTTAPIAIRVDNSSPVPHYTVGWRVLGSSGAFNPLPDICPVVERHAGEDLEFQVIYAASAAHLRRVELSAWGCGAGTPTLVGSPPSGWYPYTTPNTSGMHHWHTDPDTDNSAIGTVYFKLASSAAPGVYSFNLRLDSRAFNPAGAVDNAIALDYDYDPVYIWDHLPVQFAVVNV